MAMRATNGQCFIHTVVVYTAVVKLGSSLSDICRLGVGIEVKNVTLSADEALIEAARRRAQDNNTTLNAEFRAWLKRYALPAGESERRVRAYRDFMRETLSVTSSSGPYSRDQLNER